MKAHKRVNTTFANILAIADLNPSEPMPTNHEVVCAWVGASVQIMAKRAYGEGKMAHNRNMSVVYDLAFSAHINLVATGRADEANTAKLVMQAARPLELPSRTVKAAIEMGFASGENYARIADHVDERGLVRAG